jgi:two-component system, OmpR family, sensor histidine kinase KdpD
VGRGTLRVYLGAAPGVGKTFAMLNEGHRAKSRGTDIAVGLVETHGRALTQEQVGDLEVIPRATINYRGRDFTEMDVDAVLARKPQRVLVDELAHTNVPGARNAKRWEDVSELLDAGIDVITTVNIQHLESVNDVVERITGVKQQETIPDEIVRAADQVELVDMSPEALRRRMAHGNIYPAERIDTSLANYFRIGNLAALREIALLWVADKVEESLQQYLEDHGIGDTWETRERVVVALTGAPGGDVLIRRAARMARRAQGDLLGVHVRPSDGLATQSSELLQKHRRLLSDVGGSYHELAADDAATGLVQFARAERATQLVLGASRQSRWSHLLRGSVTSKVLRSVRDLDVHVISTQESADDESTPLAVLRRQPSGISARRRLLALLLAVVLLPLVTVVLAQLRSSLSLPSELLIYLMIVVAVAAVGGFVPAFLTAVAGFLLANYFFTPPLYTFTIAEDDNLVALIVFVLMGALVGQLVSRIARRQAEAARAKADAETLAQLGATLISEQDPLPGLMTGLRSAFGCVATAVLRSSGDGWIVESSAGEPVPSTPDDADVTVPLDADTVFAVSGIDHADMDLMRAFTGQLALVVERRRLRAEAAAAEGLAEANQLRTALLAAVSHDLRTPLASIKAAATSLLQPDVTWPRATEDEFLHTIDEETDRLNDLVGNLLDMSRLQTGAVELVLREVGFDEVVPAALHAVQSGRAGLRTSHVLVEIPETLPRVEADAGLLERAVANLIANALEASPPDRPVRLTAGSVLDRVELRVVDQGPGIPVDQRARVFSPFQRLGDRSNGNGVGLGLAVARGFVEAMGGELTIEDTPGGGATMVVALPVGADAVMARDADHANF